MRMTDFQEGWAVVGNDGLRLGTIRDVGPNYLRISRSLFASDLYVPVSAIANVEHETVHLNVARREAERMGWEQAPRHDEPETHPGDDLHRHI